MTAAIDKGQLQFPNMTLARCAEARDRAEDELRFFGGKELLGFALSHNLSLAPGWTQMRQMATALNRYANALEQYAEAVRISKWNASEGRAT